MVLPQTKQREMTPKRNNAEAKDGRLATTFRISKFSFNRRFKSNILPYSASRHETSDEYSVYYERRVTIKLDFHFRETLDLFPFKRLLI